MSGTTDSFPTLLEGFFVEWLQEGRGLSPNTVASYRDAFALLLRWLDSELGVAPRDVTMDHMDRGTVLAFLAHLESGRGCKAATVNNRLAAIKSFCSYATYRAPQRIAQLTEIIDIPQRKAKVAEVEYLTPEEVGWIVSACPKGSEAQLLLQLLYNTGARVSEVVGLRARDVSSLGSGKLRVTLEGKGRKQRTLPLWRDTSELLSEHVGRRGLSGDDYLFPGRGVDHLTRSGARSRIEGAVRRASCHHPELVGRRIGAHTFRHSCAMAMLAAGVDIATVAIWLGHESVNTTHKYVVSDMRLKEEALAKVRRNWEVEPKARYRATPDVLGFLMSL